MSQDVLLPMMNYMSLIGETVNMDGNRKESCNLEAGHLKSQNTFNDLLKQFFEKNDLKAQLQDKDSTICKLKDMIKSMREKSKDEDVKYDYCDIETKNVELGNSVAKLSSKNELLCNETNHVKQVFKEQFESIKKTRFRSKEQSDSFIDKLNLKSVENEDLKAQIQDKVFVTTSLKNDLRKIKGKEIVGIATKITSSTTIVPGMFKLDLEHLAPRLLQNRDVHIKYLKYAQEQADILWGIVEQAKEKQPLDKELDFAKSKKSSHQPKAEDTNQEKLYLLHMDLCGPMRVASINGKRLRTIVASDDLRDALSAIFGLSELKSCHADSVITILCSLLTARSWSIPSWDPDEEAARQLLEQAPHSPEYVPIPWRCEDMYGVHSRA
ncbi:hypothetical protein Tco_1263417 [Tanacetum coccineum]